MSRTVAAALLVAVAALSAAPAPASAAPCFWVGSTCWMPGDELPCLTLDVPPNFVPCP